MNNTVLCPFSVQLLGPDIMMLSPGLQLSAPQQSRSQHLAKLSFWRTHLTLALLDGSDWTSSDKPTNPGTEVVVFSPTWKFAQISKTWSAMAIAEKYQFLRG